MAKPTFPIIEEGVSYNPGDLKQSLGHLWYEGVEDDINRRMVKSIDDLKRIKGGRLASQAIKGSIDIFNNAKKVDSKGNPITPLTNITKDIPESRYGLLNKIASGAAGGIENIATALGLNDTRNDEERAMNTDGINWFGTPGKYNKVSDLTPEQLNTLEQARRMGIQGVVNILNRLGQPQQDLPISPIQQQSMGISNALSGPLLLSLLNQPQQSSFAPMFASQLAQQPNQGIGDMLSMLAAPALQSALPYISSLFNRQG